MKVVLQIWWFAFGIVEPKTDHNSEVQSMQPLHSVTRPTELGPFSVRFAVLITIRFSFSLHAHIVHVRRWISMTLHGALSKCIVGQSVLLAPLLASKSWLFRQRRIRRPSRSRYPLFTLPPSVDGSHWLCMGRSRNALWVHPLCRLHGLSQKVEKCSTFQAATDPTALCKYTQGHCPMKSPL